MTDSSFDFDLKGIAVELSTRKLAVPIYQRDYAWGDDDDRDQVLDYWRDLQASFLSGSPPEYFLGTVVLSKESADYDDRDMVVDGQQRLATTAILIAAIRDIFRERGDDARADHLQTTYLSRYDMKSGEHIPQLFLNAEDDPFFRARIVNGDDTVPSTKPSHDLIARTHDFFLARMRASADERGADWADFLGEWVAFLESRVRIISVAVPTESDAFLIFETLNDRGADLPIADLLKNYLFGKAGTQLNTVRNAWVATMTSLDLSATGGKLFTDFLRHYWSSRYGATRERELYGKIKEQILSQSQVVTFSGDLQQAARLYAALLNSDHEVWAELGTITREHVEALQLLGLEQNRPLLLALIQHFGPSELRKAMRAMVAWGLRGLIVGGIGGGLTERTYCSAAVAVRSGEIKTTEDLLKKLSDIIPSDEVFRSQFGVARVTKARLARYVLVALERTARGEVEPELVPNEREEEVNLEHVLPKNPTSGEWPQFSADERKSLVHRIGNMALLQKGPNGKIGNQPFSIKKPVLEASELGWTKDAGSEADWTPDIVAKRQGRMAKVAVETWPISERG